MNTPSNIPNLKVQLHILPDLRLPDGCRPHESAQRPRGRIPISTCKPKNISIKNIATQVSDTNYHIVSPPKKVSDTGRIQEEAELYTAEGRVEVIHQLETTLACLHRGKWDDHHQGLFVCYQCTFYLHQTFQVPGAG